MTENVLWCKSAYQGNQPIVLQTYGDRTTTLTVTEARAKADAFYHAAAVAEQEAIAYLTFEPKGKGFVPVNNNPGLKFLRLLRSQRAPFPPDIKVIFGHRTREATVVFSFHGQDLAFSPAEARDHARGLLQTADAAESDAFLYQFLSQDLECSMSEAEGMVQRFALFRNQNRLEDLLGDRTR